MTTFKIIRDGFQELNVAVTEEILRKCENLCNLYNIDPEDFVDQWLAYTASHLNGAPPSLETLDEMERKDLQKQKKTYQTPKAARQTSVIREAPDEEKNIQEELPETEHMVANSPIQEIPSQLFLERTDSRAVQCSFGDCKTNTFKESGVNMLAITIQNEDIIKERYMYEKMSARADAINYVTRWICGDISKHYKLELSREELDEYYGNMIVCGRIYSENSEKLHAFSLTLEGVWELYEGKTVNLTIDKLDKYSLFSGQVVVIEGLNDVKTNFKARKLYYGVPLPLPEKPVDIKEPLQIVVAAGPFTMTDNLLYEPLEELLKYVVEFKPNLLILMGPFVEGSHKILEKANQCYESFFEGIVDGIMTRIKGTGTQVILVPSDKDVHHHVIFPNPQFQLEKRYENLICAPNPFILDVNGLVIGGSTTDILFHLNNAEISKGVYMKGFDKIRHLITHLFNQRSFYPLHPPDPEVIIDYTLWEKYALLEELPHLMFLPSKFKNFVRNVDGCIVVNPEQLMIGSGGGTFARVEVRPGNENVCDRVSCQILRV